MSTTTASTGGARVHVQKFGTFLSNMIMPNIPALIAWGLFTALFIPVGWTPNASLTTMVGPAIHYLLPILIAGTGGRIVYGDRGAVVGAFSVMGAIAGSDLLIANFNADALAAWTAAGKAAADFKELGQVHMFIGAMIMGPLAAWVMKKLDRLWDGKVKAGFEMLVNMFSAGITAFVMSIFAFFIVARVVNYVMDVAGHAVEWLINTGFLPLASVLIEPAKVFFLNNAINHGVLTPLGLAEAADKGKSVLFLLEANPGPGLGLLLAYSVFGRGVAKATAPGAAIIHFFGGIHEIYFPYVLAKPKLIIAMIAGGATGVALNVAFGVGLRAPAAPGSVFAVYAQTAKGDYLGVTIAMLGAAAVTFIVAALLLRLEKGDDEVDLAAATASMEAMKGKKSSVAGMLTGTGASAAAAALSGPVKSIVFACDAGMGSSAMGASVLRRKIQAAGFGDISVVNKAIANLTDDVDILVTHQDLANRAKQGAPSAAMFTVDNFMASPVYDEIVDVVTQANGGGAGGPAAGAATAGAVAAGSAEAASDGASESGGGVATATEVLTADRVILSGTAKTRDEAIREAGELLVAAGAVESSYVDAMFEREQSVSTFMGNQLAIPHGTNEAKAAVNRTAMSFVRYPDGIEWKPGKTANYVIAIAGTGNEHLTLLANISKVFLDKAQIAALEAATSADEVLAILNG